jgi:hypothetical protein
MANNGFVYWSEFPNAGDAQEGDIIVGSRAGIDSQFTYSSFGTLVFSTISGTTQDAEVGHGYIIGNSSLTTINLPLDAIAGEQVAIQGYGSSGWLVQAGAGVTLQIGSTASSIGGTVASSNRWDSIQLICLVNSGSVWALYAPVSSAYTIL